MPNLFEIKVAPELRDFRLDPKRRGKVVYTVRNVTGQTVIARAQLEEDDSLVKDRSVMLLNEKSEKTTQVDEEIRGNGEQTFKVSIEMSQTAEPGKYGVPRLKFCDAANPDIKDYAPPVSFELPQTGQTVVDKRWWWIPIAVSAALLIAVGIWLFLTPKNVHVPNLADLSIQQAQQLLEAQKLSMLLDPAQEKFKTVPGAEVDSSEPPKDKPVKQGSTVKITLKVPVPNVAAGGIKLRDACQTLADAGLNCLPISGALNPDAVVISQTPATGYLPLGQEVDLTFPGLPPPPPPGCRLPIIECLHLEARERVNSSNLPRAGVRVPGRQ